MNFSNHGFLTNSRIWEYIQNTNSVFLPKLQNKECCAKTRLEFVEIHTNSLDPYLIGFLV